MSSFERATEYFLDATLLDQVAGYLQETQARALHALLEQKARIGLAARDCRSGNEQKRMGGA